MKLIAVILLVAVGWLAGGEEAKKLTGKYTRLRSVLSLLRRINDGIRFSRTCLHEIFASFDDDALGKCGFMAFLASSPPLPLKEAWKNAVSTLGADDDISSVLVSLGDGLGTTDFATQTEKIEMCISFLSKRLDEMSADIAKKAKSYRSLGALASLAAAIILY